MRALEKLRAINSEVWDQVIDEDLWLNIHEEIVAEWATEGITWPPDA